MKILQLHSDFIEYTPIKKEIGLAEDARTEKTRVEDVLVLFTAVEDGDNDEVINKAVSELKVFSEKIAVRKILIYPFAHLSQNLAEPESALTILEKMEKEIRKEGFEVSRAPFGWNKAFEIKVKGHPLAEMSRNYLPAQEEKIQRKRRERTRKELLSRMKKVEFVGLQDNDHRILGEKLDLFTFYEPSPSMPYWHDKGLTLRNILIETIRKEIKKRGYLEISTALLANVDLWKVSGHFEHYKDNMFLTKLDEEGEELYGLKPMNCPSTILYFMSKRWSYKDLPLRIADFDTLFRKELSGVVSGLFRVKSFTQDDAHIFCTEEQVESEIDQLFDLVDYFYSLFSLSYSVKLSTMPEQHLGSEEQWKRATEILLNSAKKRGLNVGIKERDAAFYGPKLDFQVKDSMGREWQCATIQLDYNLPERFDLRYVGKDGKEHRPVIIHRVIYGSIERFIGILLEHYSGRLPVWLSPVQAVVLPVSESNLIYAKKVFKTLIENDVRAEIYREEGTLNSKIREVQLKKIPYAIIVGKKEEQSKTISIRERGFQQRNNVLLEDFIKEIKEKVTNFN